MVHNQSPNFKKKLFGQKLPNQMNFSDLICSLFRPFKV